MLSITHVMAKDHTKAIHGRIGRIWYHYGKQTHQKGVDYDAEGDI